jgi:hypothetical protein
VIEAVSVNGPHLTAMRRRLGRIGSGFREPICNRVGLPDGYSGRILRRLRRKS